MGYLYIVSTLILTVYGQLIIKWQISKAGHLPSDFQRKIWFLLSQFVNPWILTGFASAFLASLAWMAAMTKFELCEAYPFMSLAFVLVMAFSVLFLGESFTLTKVVGTAMVVAGLIVITR